MYWRKTTRACKVGRPIADRHYNRQKVGSPQFVPPGRCVVLVTAEASALWVTSWPYAEYVQHDWAGAWVCSLFRREDDCPHRASELIRQAVAATRAVWPDVPSLGMVTFIDPTKVRPMIRRGRPYFGYTWELAGFEFVGRTKGGLLVYQMIPFVMPGPVGAEPLSGV